MTSRLILIYDSFLFIKYRLRDFYIKKIKLNKKVNSIKKRKIIFKIILYDDISVVLRIKLLLYG